MLLPQVHHTQWLFDAKDLYQTLACLLTGVVTGPWTPVTKSLLIFDDSVPPRFEVAWSGADPCQKDIRSNAPFSWCVCTNLQNKLHTQPIWVDCYDWFHTMTDNTMPQALHAPHVDSCHQHCPCGSSTSCWAKNTAFETWLNCPPQAAEQGSDTCYSYFKRRVSINGRAAPSEQPSGVPASWKPVKGPTTSGNSNQQPVCVVPRASQGRPVTRLQGLLPRIWSRSAKPCSSLEDVLLGVMTTW